MDVKIKAVVIDKEGLKRTISRLAFEIIERNHGVHEIAIVGVRTRGAYVAERIVKRIEELEGVRVPYGVLDITLYRDDFRKRLRQPVVQVTDIPFEIDDIPVVIVDDVLFTGRTSRAAMDALMDFGRRRQSSSRFWSTAATVSCRSTPITSARAFPHRSGRRCRCG